MPAEDVLEWVGRRRLSAPIAFEHRDVQRSLVVENGAIVWASSNRRDEQLGAIVVRSGLVGERALAEALEARSETGVPLGKVLLMSGVVTEVELIEILATKIREAVTDILTWTEGQFDVVPRSQPPATGVNAQLPIEICLTVARRRTSRMIAIMQVLGADDVTFSVPHGALPPAAEPAQVIDLPRIWAMAGDRRTAADIAAAFAGERYATYDALARMVETGRLAIDRRHRERTSSAFELAAGARGRLRWRRRRCTRIRATRRSARRSCSSSAHGSPRLPSSCYRAIACRSGSAPPLPSTASTRPSSSSPTASMAAGICSRSSSPRV